ncbi:MAG TPA: PEGA domain-containing protein [Candidatus Polarisedimenticolaceae bacterium]
MRTLGGFAAGLLGIALFLAPIPARGQAQGSAELEAARVELEAARFDKALAVLDALLARPDLEPSIAGSALALRAQARVATGDLGRAEQDWKRLLLLRPDYEPDPTTTGRKARERFDRVASTVVGGLKFEIDPPGARIAVDGRLVTPAADGTLRLPAGDRRIEVEHPGFDPASLGATVIAGDIVPVRVRLVPNARSVVLRTEPDGVEVRLDGTLLGVTARPSESAPASAPAFARAARLEIADLPLGEHVFELTKPCYRTTRVRVQVQVDVTDRGAIALETVALDPARAVVAVRGKPEGAEVRADGVALGRIPLEGAALCAGTRAFEVRAGGRVVWRERVELPEQGTATLEVAPRPQAVLLGSATWPAALRELEGAFGVEARAELPAGTDLGAAEGWASVTLPADTDLAVAVLPAGAGQGVGRVVLYSPILRTLETLEGAALSIRRPSRVRPTLGWRLADLSGGGVVVAEVIPGGPASAAGVVAGSGVAVLAGRVVASAAQAHAVVAGLPPGSPVTIDLVVPGEAEPRKVEATLGGAPVFAPKTEGPGGAAIAAAWGAVDGVGAEDRRIALAQLGSLLLVAGRAEAAADAFSRAASPPTTEPGAIDYLLGRALAAAGREAEARAAFSRVREGSSRAEGGDGPPLAPAAADHLADLGVGGR